ncbi:MAG: monovalent cation/H+ antiporter subunit E [Halobacteriota archaeon]
MSEKSARILVPVGPSPTYRNTVAYAVREALDAAESSDVRGAVHFVYPAQWRRFTDRGQAAADEVEDLLERTIVWVTEDLDFDGEDPDPGDLPIDIETAIAGEDRYLFAPGDYASSLSTYARKHDLDRFVIDPEFQPGGNAPMLQPLELELRREGFEVEEAPVERTVQRSRLPSRTTLSKVFVTFASTYGFYLLIGGTLGTFNLATGAVVATLATAVFSRIAFVSSPSFSKTLRRSARGALYVPYLLWEIAKANVAVAYIILHPKMPIDPGMRRFRAAVWGDLPVTTLANSITLTPGTLTVDVRDSLYIHTLTEQARVDLAGGALERAVRFVFYGRDAADVPTPIDRDAIDDEVVYPEEDS